MPNTVPRESLTVKQTAAGVGMFAFGVLLPVPLVLLIKPLFLLTVSLGVATLVSTVLIPKFALAMYAVAVVLLVGGFILAVVGLTWSRLRPLAAFLLGLAFSIWIYLLHVGLWFTIAYKGAGYK